MVSESSFADAVVHSTTDDHPHIRILYGMNEYSAVTAFIGLFIISFGLFSFLIKEKAFLSDSLVATLVGIIFGPLAINLWNPKASALQDLQTQTFFFADFVINIQIMAAAIQLPRRFWRSRWKSLLILLGPITIYMWLITAVIFYYVGLGLTWNQSLLLASTCAPTDPILANSIVNGRFAELHINKKVRTILSGESAANDGTVFPFFHLALLLIKFPVGEAFARWSYITLLYMVTGGMIFGIGVGYVARKALKYSDQNNWIDKKNLLAFELALAVFVGGTATVLDMSSFLAVLMAGITFSWDDWFEEETEDANVQEVIDMLVNTVFFLYFGAIIPWSEFGTEVLPLWKLFSATILILFVRRLPAVVIMMKFMSPLLTLPEAVFVGWFGPVGVGALWYQGLASHFFPENELFYPIVCFVVLASVICHGIMVPFVHLTIVGIRSRTLSRSMNNGINVPQWPVGSSMEEGLEISGPQQMVKTADGRMISADSIVIQKPNSKPPNAQANSKENNTNGSPLCQQTADDSDEALNRTKDESTFGVDDEYNNDLTVRTINGKIPIPLPQPNTSMAAEDQTDFGGASASSSRGGVNTNNKTKPPNIKIDKSSTSSNTNSPTTKKKLFGRKPSTCTSNNNGGGEGSTSGSSTGHSRQKTNDSKLRSRSPSKNPKK